MRKRSEGALAAEGLGQVRRLGKELRLKRRSFKTEIRRNSFSHRVVNLWNSLLQKDVEARSLSVFETEIDRFLINKGIRGYGEKAGEWG